MRRQNPTIILVTERSKEHLQKKQSWTQQEYKDHNKQYWGNQKHWKDYDDSTWNDYGDYGSQSDSSRQEDSHDQRYELQPD